MADFAAGQLHPYQRWLVEAHLELCPNCRRLAALGARIGGAWMEGLSSNGPDESDEAVESGATGSLSADFATGLWDQLEAQLLVEQSMASRPAWPEMPLPESVRREIETAASETEWVPVGPSSSRVVRVALDPDEELEFFLVRTPAGATFPPHRHLGGEHLLILSGSLRDTYGELRAGDLWHYPTGSSHAPVIGPECECFAVTCVRGGLDFET